MNLIKARVVDRKLIEKNIKLDQSFGVVFLGDCACQQADHG